MTRESQGASVPEWRRVTVSPYRSYEVSSDGRIKRDGRELKGDCDKQGYRSVLLSYAGLKRRFRLHRLICEAFHGPPPPNADCAHADGCPANNRADNLRWATRSENMADAKRHGTFRHPSNAGEMHPNAKLSATDMAEIRASNEAHRVIARRLGVTESAIRKIRKGDAWTTV